MKRIIIVFFMVMLALSFGACFGKDNYSSTALSSVSSQQANSSISQDSSSSQKESDSSIKSTAISSLESSSSQIISSSSEPIFSSDTSFMLSSVFGFNVANDTINVKPIEYDNIVANKNAIIQNSVYTLADKASVVASLKEDLKNITYVITAEDGTTATYVLSIAIEDLFDTYGNGLGNANGFVWDSASTTYITNYGGATEIASGLYYKGDILSGNYLVSMDVALSNLTADATFMLIARVSDTMRIRYIIKATSDTQIEVASDYNDGYKDLDYTVHVSAFTYLDKINIGVVVNGTDVAMLFNGEIVYHRGLEELSLSQMVVSANGLQVSMDNIVLNNSATQVLAEYTECIKNYRDAIVGNTIGQTHNLNKVEQDLNSGTVKVNMANTTTGGPMVSFRYNGNPVAGYSFAVTGNIRVVTVSGISGHVVFMAYQDMDNVLRYFINRNDSPNNTCYYRINDNGVWSPSQTTNTMCPNTKNILTDGLDWTAPFHFIYSEGKIILYLEGKHIMTYECDWGYVNAILNVVQNAEVTYSNIYATTNADKVKEILSSLQESKTISFGSYGENLGSGANFASDTTLGGYATQITSGKTYFDSGVYLNGNILSKYYAFYSQVSIPTLVTNGEFVISAFTRNNKQIRYIIRATSTTQIEIASDYRDDSAYLDYTVHVSAFTYSTPIYIGFIVNGNDVAMLYNGQVVYHRALENFANSELVIASANSMQSVLKSVVVENDQSQVINLYKASMANYKDDLAGNTIGQTHNLNKVEQDLNSKTFRINMANTTSNAPMVSFRNNGNPVAGYSFVVTGTINATTVSGKSGHITFMCYSNNNNWSRFIINRASGNNSCYFRYKNAGVLTPSSGNTKSSYASNTLTDGLNWIADFVFIYDSGYVALYIENKLMMRLETEWGFANAILEIPQNVDITYSNLTATTNALKVEEMRKQIEQTSAIQSVFTTNNVWSVNQDLSFIKNDYNYGKASVAVNGNELISNEFYFRANVGMLEPNSNGQAEILLLNESSVGFRYVLEYLSDGSYQIFTQKVTKNTQSDWAIVASNLTREMVMGVAVVDNTITFFINNVKMHNYSTTDIFKLYLGGEKCIVKVKNIEINTNGTEVQNFVIGLKEDAYVSGFLSRAQSIASSYAGEPTGQTLLMGSSSIDLWKERTDSNGNKVAGYLADLHDLPDDDKDGVPDVLNVGIGGTTYQDWLSFYDILVKPFLPAPKIVLYCGANDVYKGGSSEDTFANYKKLIEKILADSPNSVIYYVRTNPSKTLYGTDGSGAVWQRLTAYENMVSELASTTTNLVVIDMVNDLKDANGPIPSLWDADGTHLNREGYAIWTSYVRKAMGLGS